MVAAPQLYTGPRKPDGKLIEKARNGQPLAGGLWTSTYDPASGSELVQIKQDDEGYPPEGWRCWVLTPSSGAVVYTVDTPGELVRLCADYPLTTEAAEPDFEKVATDYEGVRVTANGLWACRHRWPLNAWGWQAEATFWLRWAFVRVDDLGVKRW